MKLDGVGNEEEKKPSHSVAHGDPFHKYCKRYVDVAAYLELFPIYLLSFSVVNAQ